MDIKKEIVSNGFKIRWITCACFEIELPGGKKIITDPYINDSFSSTIKAEDVTGADYILITHTHFDHVTDVGYLADKYNSKVLVGMLSAYDLATYYDMNFKHILAVTNGDVFKFEDVTIEVLFGKHIDLPFTASQLGADIAERHGYKGMERVNSNGSIEFVNYLITTKNNIRILLWGGKVIDEQYYRIGQLKPNIAIMQIPGNSMAALSRFIGHIKPQIVIPHHHDSMKQPGPLGIMDVDQYLADLVDAMKLDAPETALLNADLGQWYQVNTSVTTI